ncbi:Retrotransposon-derived protein PEG10 AltName: Full=Embryonal carcinoma differentiation-regulated protein [Rhizoctonia solani AG-1 IB]|uniref:PEG10 protein n=1 Tax=Thanatephorus cucumeris (strain AG1-IB / isolate 7/3/14) TaxID=1108050 RepID=M5CDN1_THACB|nr:Retrotransposon-derived protein PEG10 AltName: Full=Embryonal carcinoma differentiation-regulated protein [Rhizoctonia solani AG-1 IB]
MGEGEPTKWANPLMQKHLNNTSHRYLTSWEAFKGAFLLNFSDPSKRDKAIREINSLRQTGSAQIYASQFRILIEDLDWDETALIDTFKKGLRYNLQRELLCMRISNLVIDNYSLEQVIETAIRADDILQQANALRGPHSQPRGAKKDQSGETRTRKKKERYPTETFLKRSQEGLYPKCGKKGHTMKRCPEKHYIPDSVLGKKGMENEQKEGEFMGSKN